MAITGADSFFAAARQSLFITKTATTTTVAANPSTVLDLAGNPGAGSLAVGNITTGVVPVDTDAGYPTINAFGGGAVGYLASASFRSAGTGGCILYDRLWHAGSVSMTALATTSFASQPSIAGRLPGGSYNGLEILIEINAAVSNTATTISVGYTNQDGTTGRTTGATVALNSFATRRLIWLPLQAGDKGVQKIDSVTVGGTVATSGSFNVILARRLAFFDVRLANALDMQGWDILGAPQVFADSALWPVVVPDSTSSNVFRMDMQIING